MAKKGEVVIKIDGDDSGFKEKMGGLGGIAKKGLAGVGVAAAAAGAAVLAIGKQALEAYADFEQLAGGTELLFGEASDFIMQKSKQAFKTVQMSQNDYLRQANGFAVGLKTSLNGDAQAAAKLADKIVTAEADIIAATGNSQEAVQNAFNGIMKSNYTMLDNLQLGITPTKAGMQEVIDKVNEWNAANGEATHYMIDNLADVQSALVDYVEMQGMAGYAAAEGAQTIQGSIASLKGAWDNLMSGLMNPDADIDKLADDLINSARNVLDNLTPVIESFVQNLPVAFMAVLDAANSLLPTVFETLGNLIPQVLTALVSALPTIIDSVISFSEQIIEVLPSIIESIVSALPDLIPQLITGLINLVVLLLGNIGDIIQPIIEALPEIIVAIVDGLISNLPTLIEGVIKGAIQLVEAIVVAAPQILFALIEALPEIISSIIDTILDLFGMGELKDGLAEPFQAAVDVIKPIWEGITDFFDLIINTIKGIFDVVDAVLSGDFEEAARIIENIWDGVKEYFAKVWIKIKEVFAKVGEWFGEKFTEAKNKITEAWSNIKKYFSDVWEKIKSVFTNGVEEIKRIGKNIVEGLWNGINGSITWLKNKIKGFCNSALGTIKDFFGIASPAKVIRDEVGKMLVEGLAIGIEENAKEATDAFKAILDNFELQRDFGIISEDEYYTELEKLRDQYLKKGTKEWYEYTLKIYEYQEDLYENEKTKLEKALGELDNVYDDWLNRVEDRFENIEKERESFASKLKDYGDLYTMDAVVGVEYEWQGNKLIEKDKLGFGLNDLSQQTAEIQHYADNLKALKSKNNVPVEFFQLLRGMSIKDGITFTDGLLAASEGDFDTYMQQWKDKQAAAEQVASELYQDDFSALKTELEDEFGEIPDEFFKIGKDCGEDFVQSFMEAVSEKLEAAKGALHSMFANVMPTTAYAGAGAYSSNSYSTTYVLTPSKGESTADQIQTVRDDETRRKLSNF